MSVVDEWVSAFADPTTVATMYGLPASRGVQEAISGSPNLPKGYKDHLEQIAKDIAGGTNLCFGFMSICMRYASRINVHPSVAACRIASGTVPIEEVLS